MPGDIGWRFITRRRPADRPVSFSPERSDEKSDRYFELFSQVSPVIRVSTHRPGRTRVCAGSELWGGGRRKRVPFELEIRKRGFYGISSRLEFVSREISGGGKIRKLDRGKSRVRGYGPPLNRRVASSRQVGRSFAARSPVTSPQPRHIARRRRTLGPYFL